MLVSAKRLSSFPMRALCAPFLSLALCLTTCMAAAKEPALQMSQEFKDGVTTASGQYKGMEFGYTLELFAY